MPIIATKSGAKLDVQTVTLAQAACVQMRQLEATYRQASDKGAIPHDYCRKLTYWFETALKIACYNPQATILQRHARTDRADIRISRELERRSKNLVQLLDEVHEKAKKAQLAEKANAAAFDHAPSFNALKKITLDLLDWSDTHELKKDGRALSYLVRRMKLPQLGEATALVPIAPHIASARTLVLRNGRVTHMGAALG